MRFRIFDSVAFLGGELTSRVFETVLSASSEEHLRARFTYAKPTCYRIFPKVRAKRVGGLASAVSMATAGLLKYPLPSPQERPVQ